MYKCAIYTRVSTEEQAENPEGSIKNQELRLREFVKLKNLIAPFGEVESVFCDPGVSAKDMTRPAFQKMLRAIEKREVNLVLVTELSRFTRSTKDFSLLQEFLKKHNCEFLSLRENFDSSSATGSLVMSIMATLAEFERKQTAERISNSFHERAKRGLYNGGSVPLGYEVDAEKPGCLKIVPEEADLVRFVFTTFLKMETIAATAKKLNAENIPIPSLVRSGGLARRKNWNINMLYYLLKHKGYVGVRIYKDKKGNVNESKAAWEPIIDREIFDRVQDRLTKNCNHKRTHGTTRYPYTLSGTVFCKTCGHRMAGKSAHGRNGKIAYYEHSYQAKQQANSTKKIKKCDSHTRIQAVKIEPLVWLDVKDFLTNEKLAKELLANARSAKPVNAQKDRKEKLAANLKKTEMQIEALAERVADLPKNLDPKVLYAQLEKLQMSQLKIKEELETTPVETDEYISFENLQKFTAGLKTMLAKGDENPELQNAIIRKIVHKIEILPNGYEIFYHAGINHFEEELGNTPGSSFFRSIDPTNEKRPAFSPRGGGSKPSKIFTKQSVVGSTLYLNGGRERDRTDDPHNAIVVLYQLSYAPPGLIVRNYCHTDSPFASEPSRLGSISMWQESLDKLANKKFILVTGKGGSGKSLLSIALAHRLSLQGRKVLLAEIGRKRDKAFSRLPELLGLEELKHQPSKVELEGTNPIYASVLQPAQSLAEYVDMKLPTGGLAGILLNNKITASFLEVVPGLPDLVALGKLWYAVTSPKDDLRPDCVILDAPATGHAMALLRAPENFRKITKAGPIFRDALQMAEFFSHPEYCAIVLTTLPEEMSLQETLETKKNLAGFPTPLVFVNKCFPARKKINKLSEDSILEKAYLYSLRRREREQESISNIKEKFTIPFFFPEPKAPPLYRRMAEALGNE